MTGFWGARWRRRDGSSHGIVAVRLTEADECLARPQTFAHLLLAPVALVVNTVAARTCRCDAGDQWPEGGMVLIIVDRISCGSSRPGIECFIADRQISSELLVLLKVPSHSIHPGSSARAEPAHVDRFWRSIRHTTCFRPRMCLLGVSFILLPIFGVKSPKPLFCGRE